MDLWIFKPNKDGWSSVLEIRFPSYVFWGIVTIIAMIASIGRGSQYAVIVQVASTLFLLTGIFSISKKRRG